MQTDAHHPPDSDSDARIHCLEQKIESGFRLNKRDLMSMEFGTLVALEFALHLPVTQVFPHYRRLQ